MDDANARRIRLQKFLSQAEICSRRAAETLIANGEITVNGHTAELGQTILPGVDDVRLNGRKISPANRPRLVLMMNKPRGCVCTNLDPHDARTVFQLVPQEYAAHKLFCVGRLDKDSECLLLITNDGDLANRIIHPSSNILKRYEVTLNRDYDPALTPRLLKGVKIKNEDGEDEFLQFANVVRFPDPRKLEIHLKQGRKREIRRLFEVFGFFVKTLVRFQIGGLILKKMPHGDCRKLSQKEIDLIFAKGGNASPRASVAQKISRAALRGEKASERKKHPGREKKSPPRGGNDASPRERGKNSPSRLLRGNAPAGTRAEAHDAESTNPWQRGIRPHHKNSRTRNYASRRKK